MEKLIELFSYSKCLRIVFSVIPPLQGQDSDCLIFLQLQMVIFPLKKTYELIACERQQQRISNQKVIWRLVWKKGIIQLQIRLFLSKLLSRALTLNHTLARRLHKGDYKCQVCGEGEEDTTHLMFHCSFLRAYWFFICGLTSDTMGIDSIQGLIDLGDKTTNWEWTQRANILWALWRCRNE